MNGVVNIVVVGVGGQGVLRATDVIAVAAFLAGFDVKKTEVHGMSQRGGSVVSDVRFGQKVLSPMVPDGEADFVLLLDSEQEALGRARLKPTGVLLGPAVLAGVQLPDPKTLNVAMVGVLSCYLVLPEACWTSAIAELFPEEVRASNLAAFELGRRTCSRCSCDVNR